jgi:hypothetical protein
MITETLDITGWRNAPFPPYSYAFTDEEDAAPVDLTGYTAALDVRAVAGTGSALISLDTTVSTSADGIRFSDPTNGVLVIQVDQASMQAAWDAAYAAGLMKAGETAPLVYDLRLEDSDGYAEVWLEGAFNIEAGVTL